jgi:peptide/nickel transport system permease protein
VTLTFFSLRLVAGDPLSGLIQRGLASTEQVESLRRSLGLDVPLLTQYVRFLGGILRGDFGVSLYTRRPVKTVIAEQLPATLQLALGGFVIAILLGIILGAASSWRHGGLLSRASTIMSGLTTALPVAFTGILALLVLRVLLIWKPGFVPSSFLRFVLPALVLGLASGGAIARVVHAGMLDSLNQPYMLAARARGIQDFQRLFWHALKPVLPPIFSMSALQAAFLLSGTVITETVFSRPGLGRLLVSSILNGDFPIVQGIVALAALLYTLSHLLSDLLSLVVDPRLRRST